VMGFDWRVPLDQAWSLVGHDVAVQGNLDPAAVLAPWDVVADKTAEVLRRAGGRPGHVFNLGHGVHPETDPANLARLVELVHVTTEQETGQ
jgi:uroporphyrinogen decarboxylase